MKKLFFALVLLGSIAIGFSSCRTGYGCKGRSKTITGYRSPMGFGY